MTALRNACSATDTVLDIDTALNIDHYPSPYIIDSEVVDVLGGGHALSITVDRGIGGSTATSHINGSTLSPINAFQAPTSITIATTGSDNASAQCIASSVDGYTTVQPYATTTGYGKANAGGLAYALGPGDADSGSYAESDGVGLANVGSYAYAAASGAAVATDFAVATTGTATAGFSADRNGTVLSLIGSVDVNGVVHLSVVGLPTTDPGVAGEIYSDGAPSAGVPKALKVSGG